MAERISDKLVRALEPPQAGNSIVYDSEVSGFGIRITKAGNRSFVFNYRIDGRERRYTIGAYGPNEWGVAAARKRAGELRKMVARGDDPLAERVGKRQAPTVGNLCDRYIEDHLPRKRPSGKIDDTGMIKGIIRPKLGNRKVANVRHADIDALHRSMKAKPYRANRTLALISKMFSLSIKWGWRSDNPARGVERFSEAKRTRYLSADEIKRLTETLVAYPEARAAKVDKRAKGGAEKAEKERVAGKRAADIVRLCLLTGCRRGEALLASWGQLDLAEGIWIKPGATTKQKTEHRAPLSIAAITLLNDILAAADKDDDGDPKSEFVFPGRTNDAPLSEIKTEWAAIRKAAKIPDVRLHDLRHTFASILASAGQSLPIIGALLGHTNPATTARYAHLLDDPLKKATNTVGHIITGKKSAEVKPLHKDGAA